MSDEFPRPSGDAITDRKRQRAAEAKAASSFAAPPGWASAQLEWLWANCKIVYWPADGRYPIEHAPHARKYARDIIEAEMPNACVSDGAAKRL